MTQENLSCWLPYLSGDALRLPIEQCVSDYLGRTWHAKQIDDKSDRASHPSATLSDGTFTIFVKLGEGPRAADQFRQEAYGLHLLTARSGVLTPTVIATIDLANKDNKDQALIVMEATTEIIEREPIHWRQIGQALAQIHAVKDGYFGLETHCYWGSLYQNNSPLADWPDFFWQRRIEPRLKAAVDSGNLPPELILQVERLRPQLPALCGPYVAPSLLHGDAHQNNFLSTPKGAMLIDPSAYFGHPELDLAHIDFFAPVPPAFFQGYTEIMPLDSGFKHRRDLWRIPAWLAMIEVEGVQHVDTLSEIVQRYYNQ